MIKVSMWAALVGILAGAAGVWVWHRAGHPRLPIEWEGVE